MIRTSPVSRSIRTVFRMTAARMGSLAIRSTSSDGEPVKMDDGITSEQDGPARKVYEHHHVFVCMSTARRDQNHRAVS